MLLQTAELQFGGTRHGLEHNLLKGSINLAADFCSSPWMYFCRYQPVSKDATTLAALPYRYPATLACGHNYVGLFTQ